MPTDSPSFGRFMWEFFRRERKSAPSSHDDPHGYQNWWEDTAEKGLADWEAQHGHAEAPSRPADASGVIPFTSETVEAVKARFCRMAQFNRRLTTKWTPKEEKALRAIFPIHLDDLELLERYYNAVMEPDTDYRRRNIVTLLNNFPGEIDRARSWTDRARTSRPGGQPSL